MRTNYPQREGDWTIDEHAELIKLAASEQCFTASEIARQLGKSRGAVIGRISRKNVYWTRSNPNRPKNSRPVRIRPKNTGLAQKIFQKSNKKQLKTITGLVGDAIYAGNGMKFIDANTSNCLWPFGRNAEGWHLCCGKPSVVGVYCLDHAQIAFQRKTHHTKSLGGVHG
jgi:GcrA cell cycle regulator